MTAKAGLGADFTMARNGVPPRAGRMLFTGSHIWTNDWQPAVPAWGYTPNTTAHDEEFCVAAMAWLAAGAANILVLDGTWSAGHPFGSLMVAFLESLGHTVTRAGSVSGRFNGLDPTPYSVVMTWGVPRLEVPGGGWKPPGWVGQCFETDVLDYYLDQRGACLSLCNVDDLDSRYGFGCPAGAPFYQADIGPPDWLGHEFYCTELGAGPFQHSIFSSFRVVPKTQTRPGTVTLYPDDHSDNVVATWVQ